MVGGSWGEEKKNYLVDIVSVFQMKGVLGIDCTTTNVLNTTELYVRKVNFMLCIFFYN